MIVTFGCDVLTSRKHTTSSSADHAIEPHASSDPSLRAYGAIQTLQPELIPKQMWNLEPGKPSF